MHTSPRFWMTVYSVWPVQDRTLQMGEEDEYKPKTIYLNLKVEIPMSDNESHILKFQHKGQTWWF